MLQLHCDVEFELFDLFLQAAEADAVPHHINKNDGEGEEGEEKGGAHIGCHVKAALRFGAGVTDDDGVNGAKEANDHEGDGGAEAAKQGIDCAKACALVGVFDALAEHEVGDIDQFGDGGGGKAGVPRPPGVPGGTSPNGTEDDGDEEEHGTDFNRRDFEAVPFHILGGEIGNARASGNDETDQADPGGADVEIEDALDVSHDGFGGGEEEGEVGSDAEQDDRNDIENGERNWFGLHWTNSFLRFTISD